MPADVADPQTQQVPDATSTTEAATAQSGVAPQSSAAGGGDGSGQTPDSSAVLAQVADLSPEALIAANPRLRDTVAGLRGSAASSRTWAQQEAERLADEIVAAERAKLAEAERERKENEVRDTDPYGFAELDREKKRQRDEEAARKAREEGQVNPLREQVGAYDKALLAEVEALPDEYKQRFDSVEYNGVEGRVQLIRDLRQAATDMGVASRAEEYEAQIAELNGKLMQTRPRPDAESGPPPTITEDMAKLSAMDKIKRHFGYA